MPAETHTHREQVDAAAILDLLVLVTGADALADEVAEVVELSLAALGADDELSILDLWSSVVEDFAERSIGDLDLDDQRPSTPRELAALFAAALTAGP